MKLKCVKLELVFSFFLFKLSSHALASLSCSVLIETTYSWKLKRFISEPQTTSNGFTVTQNKTAVLREVETILIVSFMIDWWV